MNARSLFPLTLALAAACAHDGAAVAHEATTADGSTPASTLATLALDAVSEDAEVADPAIASLRAAGPAGLEALLAAHADAVRTLREVPLVADRNALDGLRDDPELERLRSAIDRVAAQRDAFASGLYWYTDLPEAQIEAARSGRPILSLRLLGRLDEEASCANSRFFRWLLYPSPEVREAMRGYVLHWSSERPAPHITIDMGDGRTIERTITGNSVHYVLDASGRIVDAITGLHSPRDFVTRLTSAHGIAERCGVQAADRSCVATEHARELADARTAWELIAQGNGLPTWDVLVAMDAPTPIYPTAIEAMPITIGKMSIEAPMLRLMGATPPPPPAIRIPWDVVAVQWSGRWGGVALSDASRSLARLKTGQADDFALVSATAERVGRDTVQNRFTLERRLHTWLADTSVDNGFDALNARVYSELFLTPASDPWLGLREEGSWDVIEVTGSTGTQN